MGNSWGHALQRLTDEQTAARLCTMGRRDHEAEATHLFTYDYVTGRAGRVSWARKYVCDSHARKAAAKYGIQVAEPAPVGKHALEEIADSGILDDIKRGAEQAKRHQMGQFDHRGGAV